MKGMEKEKEKEKERRKEEEKERKKNMMIIHLKMLEEEKRKKRTKEMMKLRHKNLRERVKGMEKEKEKKKEEETIALIMKINGISPQIIMKRMAGKKKKRKKKRKMEEVMIHLEVTMKREITKKEVRRVIHKCSQLIHPVKRMAEDCLTLKIIHMMMITIHLLKRVIEVVRMVPLTLVREMIMDERKKMVPLILVRGLETKRMEEVTPKIRIIPIMHLAVKTWMISDSLLLLEISLILTHPDFIYLYHSHFMSHAARNRSILVKYSSGFFIPRREAFLLYPIVTHTMCVYDYYKNIDEIS